MVDRRQKNQNWHVTDEHGRMLHQNRALLAVLMDIRDEMQAINLKLGCYRIPRALDDLNSFGKLARRQLRKPKRRR